MTLVNESELGLVMSGQEKSKDAEVPDGNLKPPMSLGATVIMQAVPHTEPAKEALKIDPICAVASAVFPAPPLPREKPSCPVPVGSLIVAENVTFPVTAVFAVAIASRIPMLALNCAALATEIAAVADRVGLVVELSTT
jgi:hypothetical protein